MTDRFTSGPWCIETPMGPDEYSIVQSGLEAYEWQFIASINVGTPAEAMFPRQEAKANARLIAAAPDLYEALQQAEAFMSIALPHYAKDRNEAAEILPGIRAALAKASGEIYRAHENTAGMHNG